MLVYHGHHLIPPMVENVFRIRTQNQRLRRTKFTICSVDREFIYDRVQSQNVRPTGSCFKRLIHCIALVFWQIRIDGSHASTCFFWIESFRFISNFSPLSQISHFSSPSTDIATSPLISIPRISPIFAHIYGCMSLMSRFTILGLGCSVGESSPRGLAVAAITAVTRVRAVPRVAAVTPALLRFR